MLLLLTLLSQDLSAADTFRKIEDAALQAKSFRARARVRNERDAKVAVLAYDPKTWTIVSHAFAQDDDGLKTAKPMRFDEYAFGVDLPDDLFKIPAEK